MADGDSKDSPNIHSSNAKKLRKVFYDKYNGAKQYAAREVPVSLTTSSGCERVFGIYIADHDQLIIWKSKCSRKIYNFPFGFDRVVEYDYMSLSEFLGKQLYDQRDTDTVASNDLYVSQFVRTHETIEEAANRLHEALKWRKEIGVNDLCETSFERWRYDVGAAFYHNHDKDGRRLFFVRVKLHKKDAADLPNVKKFLANQLEIVYKEEPTKEIVVVFDMSQAGLSNLDMDLIKFVITCFKIYYPTLLGYMLIYEMPWLFNAAWKIIKAWLSAEAIAKIKFVTKSDVQEYINKDKLLEHMGGTDKFVYKYVPPEERGEEENKLKKRVTFAESAKTADGDGSPDSFQSPQGKNGMRKVGIRGTTGKMEPGVDNSFIGRLLTISPAEELEFSTDESGKETFDTISLKNTLPYPIAYKVKTTSPEKYKVRPSFGVAKPGSTVEVFVYLQQGYHNTISKDKFLVMAMEVTTESQDKLAELWKTIPKENIMEHKLRCVQSSKPSQGQGGGVVSTQEETVQTLALKVDSLMESTRQTQKMLKALGALQIIIMFLLLVGLILHYQTTPAESANYSSCPGSMW